MGQGKIDLFGAAALYAGIRGAVKYAVEDPKPVYLGYIDANGQAQVAIPNPAPDEVGMVYYTESYSEDLTEAASVGRAYNTGLGALSDDQLTFGRPIYIRHDPTSGSWYVAGQRPRAAAAYVGTQASKDALPGVLVPKTGLLDITQPESMQAIVYSAPYNLSGVWKWIPTLYVPDQTATIPATAGQALYVKIEVDPAAESLSVTAGTAFDAALTQQQVWAMDDGSGTYFPQPSSTKFLAGYIRLVNGMATIPRSLIWALQEVFTKSTGGGGGTDTDAIHKSVSGEIDGLTNKATPVGADEVVIEDSAASFAKKKATVTAIRTGVTDANAIHGNVSAEINALTVKTTPVSGDLLLIEDSAASNAKKKVTVGSLPAGVDTTAIHKATSGEIFALSAKSSLVDADVLVIEDSAASNAKKKVTGKVIYKYVRAGEFVQTGDKTIANSAVQDILYGAGTGGFAYNSPPTGTAFEFGLSGVLSTALAAGTVRLRLYVTGVLLVDYTFTMINSLSAAPWQMYMGFAARGSSVWQTETGVFTIGQTFPVSAVTLLIPPANVSGAMTSGSTGIYWTWGTADPSNTVTSNTGYMRQLNPN